MYKLLTFLVVCLVSSSFAHSLKELEALSPNPLYFNVPISEYRIETKDKCISGKNCPVSLGISFSVKEITVITDRPIRETDKVNMDEFVSYVTSVERSGLVFTLDIRDESQGKNAAISPANFIVKKVFYDSERNTLTAQSEMNIEDVNLVHHLNSEGRLIGDGAVLSVEG